jgi:RHS repeat-associated protein
MTYSWHLYYPKYITYTGVSSYNYKYDQLYRINIAHKTNSQTNYDYGFRIYNAGIGKFLSVDPLTHLRVEWTPYNAMRCNPILNVDPTGALDHEYDKDGNKISDLGVDQVNFYLQANGDTKVEDQTTCATNTIKGGEALIRGFTQRNADTSWSDIAREWDQERGPTKSLFADFTGESSSGPFSSLHNTLSSYSSLGRQMSLNSQDQKGIINMDYNNANPFVANDMWEQMWGRSNVSWYKLGDKTLLVMSDSKSMTSFAYRKVLNWERSTLKLNGNTYQTYKWIENNATIQNKVNENATYWQNQLKRQGPKY